VESLKVPCGQAFYSYVVYTKVYARLPEVQYQTPSVLANVNTREDLSV